MDENNCENFRREVYRYCDENVGKRVLFTGFAYLYSFYDGIITPQQLALVTENIVSRLLEKEVLTEISAEDKGIESPYGMYKILLHERLTLETNKKRFWFGV